MYLGWPRGRREIESWTYTGNDALISARATVSDCIIISSSTINNGQKIKEKAKLKILQDDRQCISLIYCIFLIEQTIRRMAHVGKHESTST